MNDTVIITDTANHSRNNYVTSCQEWSGICDMGTRNEAMSYDLEYAIRLIRKLNRLNSTAKLTYEWK